MSEHTMGKLSVEESFLYNLESNHIVAEMHSRIFNTEESNDNARRLVACWNLCDGIPTDQIEAAPDLGRLLAERAEMLMVSRLTANLLMRLGGKNHDPEYSELCDIIAKVEGGK